MKGFFQFNDLLLVCSERRLSKGRLAIRNNLNTTDIQVLEGDRLDVAHSFYIRSSKALIELYAKSALEKLHWMDQLWLVSQQRTPTNEEQMSPIHHAELANDVPTKKESLTNGVEASCSLCHEAGVSVM